jgi:phage-related protein
MKFIHFTLLLLVLSFSTSIKIRSNNSAKVQPANVWYRFTVRIFITAASLSDKDVEGINGCLPAGWELPATAKPTPNDAADPNTSSTLTTVLDVISKIINFACKFKTQIVALFTGRRYMRNVRLFMQTEMTKAEMERIQGLFDTLSTWASNTANWIAQTWDSIKAKATELATALTAWWAQVKKRAVELFTKVKEFYTTVKKCYDGVNKFVKNLKTLFGKMIAKYTELASIAAGNMPALANLFVTLLCQFDNFRTAFTSLANALKEPDMLNKYGFYGDFVGKLIFTLVQ